MLVMHDQMRRILSSLNGEMDRRLRDIGLAGGYGQPLLHLMRRPGITVAELARTCGQKPGNVSRLLDRLEAMGLCQRSRSRQDRRLVSVELTPAGMEKARLIPAILESAELKATTSFTAHEVEQLAFFMQRMLSNFTAHAGDKNKSIP